MKHTDDTHCVWAHRPGACYRTHVPGMGRDHHMGTQRPAAEPDGVVCQGHADYCREYGHAEGGGYGVAGLCARCGDELPTFDPYYQAHADGFACTDPATCIECIDAASARERADMTMTHRTEVALRDELWHLHDTYECASLARRRAIIRRINAILDMLRQG